MSILKKNPMDLKLFILGILLFGFMKTTQAMVCPSQMCQPGCYTSPFFKCPVGFGRAYGRVTNKDGVVTPFIELKSYLDTCVDCEMIGNKLSCICAQDGEPCSNGYYSSPTRHGYTSPDGCCDSKALQKRTYCFGAFVPKIDPYELRTTIDVSACPPLPSAKPGDPLPILNKNGKLCCFPQDGCF